MFENSDLELRAANNPIENFKYVFEELFIQILIERMDANQEIFEKLMSNHAFSADVKEWLMKRVYNRLRNKQQ